MRVLAFFFYGIERGGINRVPDNGYALRVNRIQAGNFPRKRLAGASESASRLSMRSPRTYAALFDGKSILGRYNNQRAPRACGNVSRRERAGGPQPTTARCIRNFHNIQWLFFVNCKQCRF